MARKKVVAGNWKMNTTREEAQSLAAEVVSLAKTDLPEDVALVLGVPFVHLETVGRMVESEPKIGLAAQNCSEHASGAFTGEVSAAMIRSYDAQYVILGHSERRQYFDEKDAQLQGKIAQALASGLGVIYCCGETLDQRNAGEQVATVAAQLENELFQLDAEAMSKIVIAYEPVWAIGTGVNATSDQAQEMHAAIRQLISGKYGEAIAGEMTILYGGSCKPANAPELFACPDVDGGLIGGASLQARSFIDIARAYPSA